MNKNIFTSLLLAVVPTLWLNAQEKVYSLDELFRLADENNRSIQVYDAAQSAAEEALASSKTQRLPDIDAQLALSYNGRAFITDRDYSNFMGVHIPEYGNNFSLKVNQVLYAGGAIDNSIKLSKMGKEMSELDSEKNRQEVRFVIAGKYLDIYQAVNSMRVIEQNIELAKSVLQNMRDRYAQGTALKNDITRYELQLESFLLEYSKVEDGYKILNHQLCTDVGLPEGTMIKPDTLTLRNEVSMKDELYWQQAALENNYALKQASLAKQISEKQVRLTKSASLPHLSLFAEEYLTGPIMVEVPVINKNFNYWYVGLGLQYNISSLYRNKHDVRKAKWNLTKSGETYELAKEQVNKGVQAVYTNFLLAFKELHTQEKSVELATENYDVIAKRYENGLALITDMLDASNLKLSADLKLVNAKIDILYRYYNLKYMSHEL
jgi:outer membrane protein TolC